MIPHHQISGDPDAMPLVLSHSLATDGAMWDAVLAMLDADFRVIRYDTRGHGQTPPTDGPLTLDDLVQDVIDLLDHLNIDRTHFAGLSMGGMIGMGLGLDRSDRVMRLAVCDARADAPDAYVTSWEDRIETVQTKGFSALIDPTIARWFTPEFSDDPERVARMRAIVARTSAEGYIACARALQGLDYKRRLPELTVPTLFLVGDADAGAPPAEMRSMHQITAGSSYALIEGAGHISAVEQPEKVARALAGHFAAR